MLGRIGKKITVMWEDHYSTDSWQNVCDIAPVTSLCLTTGYVVYEDDDILSVANTISSDKQECACTMNILKKLIVK